jgi:hypothetical protein
MTATADYCREVEAHLCRRNQGHLIRIVGPAFELVSGWAEKGIPLSVVCAGIDRTVERHDRKPTPRRRPVRIEFCEADVLDAFDAWRRAVGVAGLGSSAPGEAASDAGDMRGGRRRATLVAHLDRVLARLTALRGSDRRRVELDAALEEAVRRIDRLRAAAPQARGEARASLLAELSALDRTLVSQAVDALDASARARAESDARQSLAPYRERMAREIYDRALAAAIERHVRDAAGLPLLTYDAD